MKFQVAKHDGLRCRGCPAEIMRGEEMVVTAYGKNGYRLILTYHVACYIPWYTDMYNRKWSEWKHGTGYIERPALGRKPTYTEPSKEQYLNRLRSALSYHKAKGHNTKVGILEAKIAKVVKLHPH